MFGLAPLLKFADPDFFGVTPAVTANLLGHSVTLIHGLLEGDQLADLAANHLRSHLALLIGDSGDKLEVIEKNKVINQLLAF